MSESQSSGGCGAHALSPEKRQDNSTDALGPMHDHVKLQECNGKHRSSCNHTKTDTRGTFQESAASANAVDMQAREPWKSSWRYRSIRAGPFDLPPYASGSFQLVLLALVFLCGPGMFAALTGLGGGGLGNPVPVNNSLVANYASSAVVGFIAGPIVGRIGLRVSLATGGAAFAFYSACLLIYKHTQQGWLLVFGGTLLGILSSFTWTAQGTMLMTYPLPNQKGKYISLNLTAFNGGATLGSLIVFAQNVHSPSVSVSQATYVAYIVIMALAIPVSLAVLDIKRVVRSDKSLVCLPNTLTWTGTITSFFSRLRTDPHIISLFPMMFVSNFYLPYMFNDINLARFNIRTRALNVVLFYAAGIPGAYAAGTFFDRKSLSRSLRTATGLALLLALFMSIFGGAYAWQKGVDRQQTQAPGFHLIDCAEQTYVGPLFLFLAFGFTHFVFQNCIYWFMTTLAEASETASTSDFAGFFKSLQAVGAAIAWRVSNEDLAFEENLFISWIVVGASILIGVPVLIMRARAFESQKRLGPEVHEV